LEFEDFAVSPTAFSPNGDGSQDQVWVVARLSEPGWLSVWVDSAGVRVRTLADSLAVGVDPEGVVWDGLSDPDPGSGESRLLSEGTYTIRAEAWKGNATAAAQPVDVLLDLTPPVHLGTTVVEGDTLLRNGESITVETTWDASGYRVWADFSRVDSDTAGGLEVFPWGERVQLRYTVSPRNTREDADSLVVPITAWDAAGNATTDSSLLVSLHNVPVPLGSELADSAQVLHNGDEMVILSRWDRPGLLLEVDVSELDDGTDAQGPVVGDLGDGTYQISYWISTDNTRPDGGAIPIRITACTRFGDCFTDESLTVCLSNHPPVHLETRLLSERTVFKNLDTLKIETRWASPAGLELEVGADFHGVSTVYDDGDEQVIQTADSTFLVVYVIPTANATPDRDSILVPVYARDSGCGATEIRELWVSLDNTPPDLVPTLDPLPATTTQGELAVSGTAPGVPQVGIYRDEELAAVAAVDSSGAFSATIALVPGPQEITARSWDLAGNASDPSSPQRVVWVEGPALEIPKPFRPGDRFLLADPGGWDRLRLRILNLEGDLVRDWDLSGVGRYVELSWDGRNGDGQRVHTGPYVLELEAWATDGGHRRELHPFLFRR
jgi:hypothetical protein